MGGQYSTSLSKNRLILTFVILMFSFVALESTDVKVTFWNAYAEKFDKAIESLQETPVIIILASCRVGWWNGTILLSTLLCSLCFH